MVEPRRTDRPEVARLKVDRSGDGDSDRIAVIGGGVAGLAVALGVLDAARRQGRDVRVTVFEAGAEPGGNLRTLHRDGWRLEWGPNGFLDSEPATLRLVERLGLKDDLLRSSDVTRHRFLLLGGRLREIPTSPPAFLGSKVLSPGGKLRVLAEPLIPRRRGLDGDPADGGDETVAEFGRRRLGREFTEVLLDPMVKGIFGGSARRLSLAAAFPRMVELERTYGGLFRAMFALGRERRRQRRRTDGGGDATARSGGAGGPSGTLHSFTGGMAVLIQALVREVTATGAGEVRTGAPVTRLTSGDDGWRVAGEGFQAGPFGVVVDAAPAHAAAGHLRESAPEISLELQAIPFAPMAVVALGFDAGAVRHDLQGFGLLVPGREGRDLLGSLWTSSIFAGRAPAGRVLLRNMLGGADNAAVMDLDDEALVNLTLAELRPVLGLQGPPAMTRVIRHRRAIAQYEVGHPARLRRVDEALRARPGLILTGSSYRGISVNNCVKEAETVSVAALDALPARARPAAGKAAR